MNNVLLEYAHLLHYCVSAFEPLAPATLLLPRAYRRFVGLPTCDVRAATASWACVDLEVPSPLPEANPLETGPLEAPAAAAALFDDAVKSGAAGAATDPRTIVVRARSVARAARAAAGAADAAHQGAADGHAGGAEAAAGVHRSVGQPQTPTMRLERHNATDAFFDRLLSSGSGSSIRTSNGSGGSGGSSSGGRDVWLEGAVLAQLVLRPSPALRQLVEQFERSLFTPPQNHTTAGAAAAAPQAARAVGHKAGTGAPGGRHAMTSPHAAPPPLPAGVGLASAAAYGAGSLRNKPGAWGPPLPTTACGPRAGPLAVPLPSAGNATANATAWASKSTPTAASVTQSSRGSCGGSGELRPLAAAACAMSASAVSTLKPATNLAARRPAAARAGSGAVVASAAASGQLVERPGGASVVRRKSFALPKPNPNHASVPPPPPTPRAAARSAEPVRS